MCSAGVGLANLGMRHTLQFRRALRVRCIHPRTTNAKGPSGPVLNQWPAKKTHLEGKLLSPDQFLVIS